MIERGGGRTSGLTDWRLMDVLSMWACLQDQDTTGQWKQVAGWRKVCDLALAHLSRLREYRRGLAEAWPPETNAAARAYVGELDQLIDRVQRTHDAAAANYDALAAAARAIGSARSELQPLYDEYATKLRQKQAYETTVADPKAVAGSRLPERPPVTDDDLEQLNVRARGLMTGLSGELQQAQVMLRQPPPKAKLPRQVEDPDAYGNSMPIIPPIAPVPTASPVNVRHRLDSRPGISAGSPHASAGPVLGAAGSGLASPPPPVQSPSNPIPGTTAGGATSFPIPPITGPGTKPQIPATPGVNQPIRPLGGGTAPTPSPRSIPTGGLIGGNLPAGMSTSDGGVSPRRVNPVGGVIGGGGAGTAPTGGAGSRPGSGKLISPNGSHGLSPLGGSPGSAPMRAGYPNGDTMHLRKSNGTDEQRRWDPDNPWQVDKGVEPVMRPPDETDPSDPGPAIGLD
ncbi:hypothetical protein GCM10027186_16340 [Micromonospora schwarzwaldensis]